MKPVDQRYYEGPMTPLGDCMSACIASIFELGLDDIPQFVERDRVYGLSWFKQIGSWAWDYGLGFNFIEYEEFAADLKPRHWHPGYWIGSVWSRSAQVQAMNAQGGPQSSHAVVVFGGKVVHDPSPCSRGVGDPYRFRGEYWFEVALPELMLQWVAYQQEKRT